MASRLVNVRLDHDRLRKASLLRERGVTLSDVVRDAIDRRFEESALPTPGTAKAVIARIHERHPDPADLPPRTYDVHDAAAARAAIRRRIRRRSR